MTDTECFVQLLKDGKLEEQENAFGRYKESGAPFGKKNEFDERDY